jgi:cytochrome c-type biogenesis protein CcmH
MQLFRSKRGLLPLALLTVLAALSLAQSSSALLTPQIRRVGGRLACLCGTCNNTVGDCPMLECHYTKPARERIAAMQNLGMSDNEIVNAIVKDKGLQALAAPPQEGFNLLAWIMPWIAVSMGLVAIWLFIRRLNRKKAAAAAAPELDPEVLNRYRENIEKDLANLDK